MMKKIVILFLLIITMSFAKEHKTESIIFNGKTYIIAYDIVGDNGDTLKEFLVNGENFESYNTMFAIWTYGNYKGAKGLQDYTTYYVNLLKSGALGAKSEDIKVTENKSKNEVIISFYIHDEITEYDVYRLVLKNNVVTGYQYVARNYDSFNSKSTKDWMKRLDKQKIITEINKVTY